MEEFNGDPVRYDNIGQTPQLPEDLIGQLHENECLRNAYDVARHSGDSMVEGVVVTLSSGGLVSAVRHCWNKDRNGNLYDVTKDYVWSRPEFQNRLQQEGCDDVSYIYFVCTEYPAEEASIENGYIQFRYSYSSLIDYINNCQNYN